MSIMRPSSGDLDYAKRTTISELVEHHKFWGDIGWVNYEALLEACYGSKAGRHEIWVLKTAISDLVQNGQIKEQIPVNQPENPNYQVVDPLQTLAEL